MKTCDKIRDILKGIDKDECEDGWWPNSVGAEFGAKKLKEVLTVVEAEIDRRANEKVEEWKKEMERKLQDMANHILVLRSLDSNCKAEGIKIAIHILNLPDAKNNK